jgi:hypothetical protein
VFLVRQVWCVFCLLLPAMEASQPARGWHGWKRAGIYFVLLLLLSRFMFPGLNFWVFIHIGYLCGSSNVWWCFYWAARRVACRLPCVSSAAVPSPWMRWIKRARNEARLHCSVVLNPILPETKTCIWLYADKRKATSQNLNTSTGGRCSKARWVHLVWCKDWFE